MFAAQCARCHGDRGEGKIGPAITGPGRLGGYRTAAGLYEYVHRTMPFDAPASLTEDEYWAVLAFILNSNGVLPPGVTLGPQNAAGIPTLK